MATAKDIPSKAYGVLKRCLADSDLDEIGEQVRNLGYAVFDSGLSAVALRCLSRAFDETRTHYIDTYGEKELRTVDEYWTVRAPLTLDVEFLTLVLNERLISVMRRLISGKFSLNQPIPRRRRRPRRRWSPTRSTSPVCSTASPTGISTRPLRSADWSSCSSAAGRRSPPGSDRDRARRGRCSARPLHRYPPTGVRHARTASTATALDLP